MIRIPTHRRRSRAHLCAQVSFFALALTATVPAAVAQITSVKELSDVRSTDWSYAALRSIDTRHKCLESTGSNPFTRNSMTRYEFAAALNACSSWMEGREATIPTDDLQTIVRLREEFASELATLNGALMRPDPAPADNPFQLTFNYGAGFTDVKGPSFLGERSIAIPALFRPDLVKGDDRGNLNQFGFEANWDKTLTSLPFKLHFGGEHSEARYNLLIPSLRTGPADGLFIPGTGDVFSPFGNGHTVAIPNLHLIDTHYRRKDTGNRFWLAGSGDPSPSIFGLRGSWNWFGGIGYGETDANERLWFDAPAGGVFGSYDTAFETTVVSGFAGIATRIPLCDRLSFDTSARISLDFADTQARDFLTLNGTPQFVDLSKSNTSIGGAADAFFSYRLTENITIQAGAIYRSHENRPNVARVMDPTAPGGSTLEYERQDEIIGTLRTTFTF